MKARFNQNSPSAVPWLSLWIFTALIALVVMATPLMAAGCKQDGSGLSADLPPELGKVLSDDGKGADICTAPPVPKVEPKTAGKKENNPRSYKGPVAAVQGPHILDEVIVTLRGGPVQLSQIANDYGLTVVEQRFLSVLGGLVARLSIPDGRPVALVRAALALDPLVLEAVPNHIYQLNGDMKAYDHYSMKLTGIQKAHGVVRGRGVKIAIIDSAVDEDHPALKGAIAATFNGLEKVPLKDTQHGTAVALLAAGSNESFTGAAPEASLFIARAFDKTADGKPVNSTYSILLSMNWALRQKVDIVNMSFSGPKNKLVARVLGNLLANKIILVAAAGNGGPKAAYSYPGAYEGVYAVTAIDAKSRIYAKANQGKYVFAAAPGVDLIVPGNDLKISFKSGTSFGAALFSGICALALEGLEGRDLPAFEKMLIKASEDLGPPGRDKKFGFGLLRAEAFVKK